MFNSFGTNVNSTTPYFMQNNYAPAVLATDVGGVVISRLIRLHSPSRTHHECFVKYTHFMRKLIVDTFPDSDLCYADKFYNHIVLSGLRIAFLNCNSAFKACKKGHRNPRIEWICYPTLSIFFLF